MNLPESVCAAREFLSGRGKTFDEAVQGISPLHSEFPRESALDLLNNLIDPQSHASMWETLDKRYSKCSNYRETLASAEMPDWYWVIEYLTAIQSSKGRLRFQYASGAQRRRLSRRLGDAMGKILTKIRQNDLDIIPWSGGLKSKDGTDLTNSDEPPFSDVLQNWLHVMQMNIARVPDGTKQSKNVHAVRFAKSMTKYHRQFFKAPLHSVVVTLTGTLFNVHYTPSDVRHLEARSNSKVPSARH